MINIHLPASLQRFADNVEIISLPGHCTLNELLHRLIVDYPRLKSIIFNNNQISPFLVIFINGVDARRSDPNELLPENAQIEIITSLVGG